MSTLYDLIRNWTVFISSSVEIIGKNNFTRYTLTPSDLVNASSMFFGILICTAVAARNVSFEEKKLAWVISLLNSFVMMIVGAVYLIAKAPEFPNLFTFGKADSIEVFHSATTNFTALACLWFAIANIFDLIFGFFCYRKHLGVLTAYIHHSVFIWLCLAGSTGNGIFMTVRPFSSSFLLCLIEEFPTFLLALGSIFPAFRTNYGFGISFFVLRIVYHAYFLTYAFYAGAETPVLVLFLLTSILHINWFQNWLSKYGPLASSKSAIKRTEFKS